MPFGLGPELYDASDEVVRAAAERAAEIEQALRRVCEAKLRHSITVADLEPWLDIIAAVEEASRLFDDLESA